MPRYPAIMSRFRAHPTRAPRSRHPRHRAAATALCALALGLVCTLASANANTNSNTNVRVELDRFAIDQTEVTIQRFAEFARATGTVTRAEREGGGFEYVAGWQRRPGWTWRSPNGPAPADPARHAQSPAVHLTHAEAAAFCAWAGGRLPTAQEWQSAAYTEQRASPPAGWVHGQRYRWPTGHTPEGANTSDPDPWPRAAPAGATRPGVNGLYDMGGNVWEWAADARGTERRTLGGSWWYGPAQMQAEVDAWKEADFYAVYIGFRCVYPRG